MNTEELPQTQVEAIRYFADEQKAHDFLAAMRWPQGVACPHCQSKDVGSLSVSEVTSSKGKKSLRRVWNCKSCKKQFTVKVGTIFAESPLPLSIWLPAVWMLTNAKNGISSCELSRALGITQKSAWHLSHRIRTAMKNGGFEKLSGEVESDETFIGGLSKNMHASRRKHLIHGTGGAGKAIVHALLERNADKKLASKIKASVIPNVQSKTLRPILSAKVEAGSKLYTDTAAAYRWMPDTEFIHEMVDHAEQYVVGNCHTNSLENFWCLLKRTLKGTYVQCAPAHLERYLAEQVTRFNERKDNDAGRFVSAMSRVSGRRLTYNRLTGKESLSFDSGVF